MGILKFKTIGIDIYDMPIKAVNDENEVVVNESIEQVLIQFTNTANYNISLESFIKNKKYWGDFEATQALFRYINKAAGSKLLKPNAVISVPLDGIEGPFGEIFKRAISEAATSSGFRSVRLVENVLCAAIGSDFPVKEMQKMLIVYSNSWCTYFSIIFSGIIVSIDIIERSIDTMEVSTIIRVVDKLISSIPTSAPLNFTSAVKLINNRDNISLGWGRPIENKIYFAIPGKKRNEFGAWVGNYQAVYTSNYDNCIINGLAKLITDKDYIL